MSFIKLGKTKIPHLKNTKDLEAVRLSAPDSVTILMSQHIGKPANVSVAVGDKVYVGTKIGLADGFVSANVHSSVSGTVKKIEDYQLENGSYTKAVIIESDGEMTPDPSIAPVSVSSADELVLAGRECGLVGLGGAGFPTYAKLSEKAEERAFISDLSRPL